MRKLIVLSCIVLMSCNNDFDDKIVNNVHIEEEPIELNDRVEVYNHNKIEDSYVLYSETGGTSAYLINKQGFELKRWDFDRNLGHETNLLPDGRIVGMFRSDNTLFSFGGFGGVIRIYDLDGNVEFQYEKSDYTFLAHHDVKMLPNGNLLFVAWERNEAANNVAMGVNYSDDFFTEALFEVNPTTNQVVWEWHSNDHLIQDFEASSTNYGNVSQNPHKININYSVNGTSANFMHINGIEYNEAQDVLYLSVFYYNEVWVIDHSTTTSQAASNVGGNYNKGGDLLYRFGNPLAYNNPNGNVILDRNHTPFLIPDNYPGAGNLLIYSNGDSTDHSTVYEVSLPNNFQLTPDANNEPSIIWSFTDTNLHAQRFSGAVRLHNGNTLIAEGDYGIWEVSPSQEVVWKYNAESLIWRAKSFLKTDPVIGVLGLNN